MLSLDDHLVFVAVVLLADGHGVRNESLLGRRLGHRPYGVAQPPLHEGDCCVLSLVGVEGVTSAETTGRKRAGASKLTDLLRVIAQKLCRFAHVEAAPG